MSVTNGIQSSNCIFSVLNDIVNRSPLKHQYRKLLVTQAEESFLSYLYFFIPHCQGNCMIYCPNWDNVENKRDTSYCTGHWDSRQKSNLFQVNRQCVITLSIKSQQDLLAFPSKHMLNDSFVSISTAISQSKPSSCLLCANSQGICFDSCPSIIYFLRNCQNNLL